MATTNKKINFSYFEHKSDFTSALQSELTDSIVFIEDTKEVYTHGEFFGIRSVSLHYDSASTKLQLKDGNVVVSEMDASAFVKDDMLDDVVLVKEQESGVSEEAPYLKFVFNTGSGKSAVRVSVADLVDVYDGANVSLTSSFTSASSYSAPAVGDSMDVAIGKLLKGHADNVNALSNKQVTIVGAATTVTLNDLTSDRALISSGSGKIAVSDITATELGYLSGVTGAIQTQISGKVDKVVGKSLSTNDYTDAEKNKLAGIEANANNYSLPTAASDTLGGVKVGTNLNIDGNGVLSATDTTYTAGSGLKLSSNQFSLNVSRVYKSANSLPGKFTAIIEEYQNNGGNLPTNAWYHIVTMQGGDENSLYATQLALGMTTPAAYYRNYNGGVWSPWLRLDNPTVDATPTASSTNPVQSGGTKTYVDNAVATKSNVVIRQWVTA